MIRIRKNLVLFFLFGIIFGALFFSKNTEAASVKNLQANKEYSFDLDGDGKEEKISFNLTKNAVYKIKINGKTAKSIKLDEDFYYPCMQIFDIDKSDNKLDIWAYSYAASDDILYSALYEYSDGKMKSIYSSIYGKGSNFKYGCGLGFIASTNGKGEFTLVVDRCIPCDNLTGNHLDKIKFKLENGKISQISGRTLYFYETHGSNFRKDKALITAGKTVFYKEHNKSGGKFTVNKGVKCYPQKMYVESDEKVYVMFKMKNGKTGWLYTGDYSWDKLPFSDMPLFG